MGLSSRTLVNGPVSRSPHRCHPPVSPALALAMNRDGSSGGVAYMVTVDGNQTEEKVVLGNELPAFFDQ